MGGIVARIRTIKPEFWTSAQVLECSTNARLLFVGLWNFADDQGRHPDNAKQCKAEVFPADDFTLADVQGMLDELSTNGLIARYVHDGKGYFYIPGWHHQRIDKPQKPKYPDPFDEHSTNVPRTFPPDTKGYDTKGKDTSKGAAAPARKNPWGDIPEDVDPKAWTAWTDYKGGKPKKATVTALRNLLAKHSPETQRKTVEHSIANGYAGLFPEKFSNEANRSSNGKPLRVESTLANLRRLAGEEGGEGLASADGDVRGQVLDGVFERTQ